MVKLVSGTWEKEEHTLQLKFNHLEQMEGRVKSEKFFVLKGNEETINLMA